MNNVRDSLSGFHPVIQEWFKSRFERPTLPQQRGWPAIHSGQNTLISAPTGSGKTLAAFLSCIDFLLRQGLAGTLADHCQVVYISPLKALANDVQKNLAEPLVEMRRIAANMGLDMPEIRISVRTGDTPSSQRQAMIRKPPHILVTTPESLYILLTSVKGREMLKGTRTVIVDEIHAVAGDKRGSHLALSLERLEALVGERPVRIGLSATQRPIHEIARFLVGVNDVDTDGKLNCAIIDEGHGRYMDLALELPNSPLAAVCSNDTWEEIYDRLASLVKNQRTTLVFVNTRRLAERVAFHLSKRLGEKNIASHHGSLSREQRFQAEEKLKAGDLKALVATASLELGIDIGAVDMVCQLGSTRSISTLLQRVGRSGHTMGAIARGRLFPLTRDDLLECVALIISARSGLLDQITISRKPLDILAQQMVAAVAVDEWGEEELFDLCRRAYPYHDLTREEFDQVSQMLYQGFSTRHGRRGAYLHYDGVGRRFRARRGAKIAAVTSGGAIPETADYNVVLEPQNLVIGTLNEDFAIESFPGDIFQLGISSWRILKVEPGKVRVEDARGLPPTIPFWLGEAPNRTDELSAAVSRLRQKVGDLLPKIDQARKWIIAEGNIEPAAVEQVVEYLQATKNALGSVPTQYNVVFERFFDESGGMQLVVHAPFGGRINRAWGLALRKRFCRTFNFELQAAANDDAIVFSLGPQHSFPLEDVFAYLKTQSARELLVQALLTAPMFQTRWRWNATRALAILRQNGGKKVPMPLQRMRADDLLTSVFPEQAACQENLVGDVEVPDHPLVNETVHDCMNEAMDADGFLKVLDDLQNSRLELKAVDTIQPSPMAHEILAVKPYAFLDDAPLEERRTQAVHGRRVLGIQAEDGMGTLDPEAIKRVREQAWPEVGDADELHDALLLLGYLTQDELYPWLQFTEFLLKEKRVTRLWVNQHRCLWVAVERLPQLEAIFPEAACDPIVEVPWRERAVSWTREEALRELIRSRLEGSGPIAARQMVETLALEEGLIQLALTSLESEGFVLRGRFTATDGEIEWCDRRLLARIHRYTLDRLRREIEPVSAADLMRFLFVWHHLDPVHRLEGPMGLVAVLGILEGFECPVVSWENYILPPRLHHYNMDWLDHLCFSGELAWARLHPPQELEGPKRRVTRALPVAILFRENLIRYLALVPQPALEDIILTGVARHILEVLQQRGACFLQDLIETTRQLPVEIQRGLGELASWGLVTCDGFAGLRFLISPLRNRRKHRFRGSMVGHTTLNPTSRIASGRWSLLHRDGEELILIDAKIELVARQLLRRYGVVFHRILLRETGIPPWRELVRVYRRLEARGEIRGGHFVAGFSGEQYALPEAVEKLRTIRRTKPDGVLITVNGADPLNMVGILTPGQRLPSHVSNRVLFRDGIPIGIKVGRKVNWMGVVHGDAVPEVEAALWR